MVFTERWARSKVRISEIKGFRIDNHLLHYCVVHRAEFPSAVRCTVSTTHQLLNHHTDVKQGVAVARWYILQWAKQFETRKHFSRMWTAHFPVSPGRGSLCGEIQQNKIEHVQGEGPCVVRFKWTSLNMSLGRTGGSHVICGCSMASWVVVTWGPPASLWTDITENITFRNFTGGR